jgi:hypothetical protein
MQRKKIQKTNQNKKGKHPQNMVFKTPQTYPQAYKPSNNNKVAKARKQHKN